MLENKKAVIFDLDGSLADSMWIWPEVDATYMDKYNLTVPANFQKAIEGKSYTETAQYFLDTFPSLTCTLDDVRREWMEMTFGLCTTKVPLKPGGRGIPGTSPLAGDPDGDCHEQCQGTGGRDAEGTSY